MKNDTLLWVRKELCLGCGRCVESCPWQAISLSWGVAQIDQNRCNHCDLCIDVCPQGAITELTPVSRRDLHTTVTELKNKTDDLIARIDKLKDKQRS